MGAKCTKHAFAQNVQNMLTALPQTSLLGLGSSSWQGGDRRGKGGRKGAGIVLLGDWRGDAPGSRYRISRVSGQSTANKNNHTALRDSIPPRKAVKNGGSEWYRLANVNTVLWCYKRPGENYESATPKI